MADENQTVITLREVYDAVVELKNELSHTPRMIDDHEKRIRTLERTIWMGSGLATILGASLSQLISYIASK